MQNSSSQVVLPDCADRKKPEYFDNFIDTAQQYIRLKEPQRVTIRFEGIETKENRDNKVNCEISFNNDDFFPTNELYVFFNSLGSNCYLHKLLLQEDIKGTID